MTETHKAAVEALETMPSNRIYGGIKSATQFKKELGEWAFNNLDALRTLKQPAAVDVTDDEAMDVLEDAFDEVRKYNVPFSQFTLARNAVEILKKNNLRITRAAATDGVKS